MAGAILDIRELRALVDDFGDGVTGRLGTTMDRALLELEALAVELAPVDRGTLEASTSTQVTHATDDRVVGELVFATPYAARVHELPPESRGPLTQAKPGNMLGKAGPKYLERPLRHFVKRLPEIFAEAFKLG